MKEIKPIRPEEIPDIRRDMAEFQQVIECFNKEIIEHWTGSSVTIMQNTIIDRILKETDLTKTELFNKHLLDVEDEFRKAGWKVEYDKPGYCETYEASFTFRK